MDRHTRVCMYAGILLLFTSVNCKRILLLPYPFPSHVGSQCHIAEVLAKKGHEIYVGISEMYPHTDAITKTNFTVVNHKNAKPDYFATFSDSTDMSMDAWLEMSIEKNNILELRANPPGSLETCTNLLEDKDFIEKLRKLKFDVAILDGFQNSRCFYILPYLLDIPYISVYTLYEPWLARNPTLPSVYPYVLGEPYTEQMTFWQRLDNLKSVLDFTSRPGVYEMEDDLVRQYAPHKPFKTINALVGQSLLWLLEFDAVMDYPRPTMPNEVLVGGLSTRPAKPLPADLEAFASEAPEGVIIVSFGSIPANLPQHIQTIFFNTFKKLKQRVIWRFSHSVPEQTPENVKILTWLPQNDLLGHPNVRLFITHCGANGQYEGLYHGVPMLGLPLFGDQMYNAKRLHYHGFGISNSLLSLTEENFYNDIKELLDNPAYKQRISQASQIFRNQPMTPRDKAVYWIEHVLQYGAGHLRSHALDMPWYQYLVLDIVAFLLLFVALIITILLCICRCLCSKNVKHKSE